MHRWHLGSSQGYTNRSSPYLDRRQPYHYGPSIQDMPQPVSPTYAMTYPVKRSKGTPEEYDDVDAVICKEAGIWLECLPDPTNKWVHIPTVVTDTPRGLRSRSPTYRR